MIVISTVPTQLFERIRLELSGSLKLIDMLPCSHTGHKVPSNYSSNSKQETILLQRLALSKKS